MTMIERLNAVCDEIFERWDKDQRSGKLLTALAGRLPGYRNDVDVIRKALAVYDKMGEPTCAGEGPGPSTLAAEITSSPSASRRGEPAPLTPHSATGEPK